MSRRLLVLCWHNIEPTWSFGGTSPEAGRRGFERQVQLLRRYANVVPLQAALHDMAEGRPLPSRAVALTFDDGYLDNVIVAAPILHSAGLTATFFLVPGFLSGSSRVWWEELGWVFAHATASKLAWEGTCYDLSGAAMRSSALWTISEALKKVDSRVRGEAVTELAQRLRPDGPPRGRQFMNWDEAGALIRYGHDIGSHTWSHPILSQETPEVQARELGDSRRELENHFQRPVKVLAFPNGRAQDFSAVTLELVRDAGYAFALTTRTAVNRAGGCATDVPRVLLDAETDARELTRRGLGALRRALPTRRHPARRN